MCLNTGRPKNINFSSETNGKLMVLGVPILKHFRNTDIQLCFGQLSLLFCFSLSVSFPDLGITIYTPYLFGYKTGFPLSRMSTNNQIIPMQLCCNMSLTLLNNPKDLDLSYKTDLDFLGLFWKEKTQSYKRRNTVADSRYLKH